MDNLDIETVYEVAKDYNVKLLKISDGVSVVVQEDQIMSFIQSRIMDKYDLTIKKRDGIFIVYFDECLD